MPEGRERRLSAYHDVITALHEELGIPPDYGMERGLELQPEARLFQPAGFDLSGRPRFLVRPACEQWLAMKAAAAGDGVDLLLVSAFRSVRYQAGLIRQKLERGVPLEEVLRSSAAPGYSEHHTGRAVDLTAPGSDSLTEDFERTEAFRWLEAKAREFGFVLSYPRGNPHQIVYEPWHWCWRPCK